MVYAVETYNLFMLNALCPFEYHSTFAQFIDAFPEGLFQGFLFFRFFGSSCHGLILLLNGLTGGRFLLQVDTSTRSCYFNPEI
jgi:hypothetical protein